MGDELQFGLTEDEYRRVLMSNARERLEGGQHPDQEVVAEFTAASL